MTAPTSGWLARARAARWALAGLLAALAAILVFASVSTWSTARGMRETIVQGQAADLFHALRRELPPPGPPQQLHAALARFLDDHRDVGLRYLAIVEREVIASVGESVAPDDIPRPGPAILHGDIVRMSAPAGPPPHPPPPGLHRPPHGPMLVIELEPVLGAELESQAQRSLALGIAGAAGLVLVGGVFFALSRRAAQIEAQLLEQRHLAALGEMSAVLAHELKNPLASLRGHAQLLEEQLEGRARTKAERVVAETTRMQSLIEGLLAFARSGTIAKTEVDPRALVDDALVDLDRTRIDVRIADAPAHCTLDGPRMQQVIANLVDNALRSSDGRVELELARSGDALVIEVRDEGDGVPAEIRAHLFEAFRTARTRGVGLGLAVARRIVELHGGRISFADRRPRGTIFRVEIPTTG